MKKALFLFLLLIPLLSLSQRNKIDSVLAVLQTEKRDTTIIRNQLYLADTYFFYKNDSAMHYALKAKALAEKISDKKLHAIAYRRMAEQKNSLGNYPEALKDILSALEINKQINNREELTFNYRLLGTIYWGKGEYPNAMKGYLSALKISEEDKNDNGIADAYYGMALIEDEQGQYEKALKHYFSAMATYEKVGDKGSAASAYNNIGGVYYAQNKYEDALNSFLKGLDLFRETGKLRGVAQCYNNIGIIQEERKNYEDAIKNYTEALKIKKQIGDVPGSINSYTNLVGLKVKLGKTREAKIFLDSAGAIANRTKSPDHLRSYYHTAIQLDTALGDYRSAYEHHTKFILYRDSLFNEENTKKTVESQMQYEFDKKQAADSVKVEEERKINAIKFEKEKQERYYLYTGLVLVLVFLGLLFNRFRVIQKQKKIIELKENETREQKILLEVKQREIIDSINYARHIQQAQMPTEKYIQKHLKRLKKD